VFCLGARFEETHTFSDAVLLLTVDTAFARVPAKYLTDQYSAHLREVLLYHVVGGARVLASSLMDGMSIPTLNIGNSIAVTDPPPNVKLNGNVSVVLADVIGKCCPGAAALLVQ
jgi:uncharacterized surface protein with fasciclin (FAS1) repeats